MSPRDTEHSGGAPRIGAGGTVAAILVAVATGIAAWSAFGLLAAVFVESPAVPGDNQSGGEAGKDRLASYVDQFNGRTMFFTPAAPPPEPIVRTTSENDGPPVAVAPSRYDGPSIVGMANDTIWFSDKRQATVGGEAVGDLRVLSNTGAWHIVVEWQGVEFEVPFLSKDNLILPPAPESNRADVGRDAELADASTTGDAAGTQSEPVTETEQETEQDNSGSRGNSQPGDEN